jgi:hypothetical protein
MTRFCALDDIATHYRLDKDRLFQALLPPSGSVRDTQGDMENAEARNDSP